MFIPSLLIYDKDRVYIHFVSTQYFRKAIVFTKRKKEEWYLTTSEIQLLFHLQRCLTNKIARKNTGYQVKFGI